MRAYTLNLDTYPVRTDMNGATHILIYHVCSTGNNESKEFLVNKNLSYICSTDEGKKHYRQWKFYGGERIRMRPQKRKQIKDAKTEAAHEEPLVKDNTVVKEPNYFNIFECDKNLLNNYDATWKRACMANSRDKHYTELLRTITDYNNCNDAPFI